MGLRSRRRAREAEQAAASWEAEAQLLEAASAATKNDPQTAKRLAKGAADRRAWAAQRRAEG